MSRKGGFRMFPERLPQAWAVVSYGARGFAYDWWRTYEDEVVTIPLEAMAMSMGVPSKARRYLKDYLAELLESGAVVHSEGGLRMAPIVRTGSADSTPKRRPSDADSTLTQRSDDAGATLERRWSDAGATLAQRPTEPKHAESQESKTASVPSRALQTDIQRDIQTGGEGEPAQNPPTPKPLRTQTSSAHEQEVLDAFREGYTGQGAMPRVIGELRREAVEHCRDVAAKHGTTLRDAALAVVRACKPGKQWPFELSRVDPYADESEQSEPSTPTSQRIENYAHDF